MKLNNSKNYMLHHTLYSVASTLITNSIIQGFMLENGIAENTVMLYLSIVQATQVCVMFLFSSVVDKIKKVMELYAFTVVFQVVTFASLIVFCLFSDVSTDTKTVILFTSGIISNVVQALFNIISFKTPYYYLDINKIGNIQGFTGALCGISGVIFSSLLIFVTARFDYNKSMLVFFVTGAVFMFLSFCLITTIDAKDPVLPQKDDKKKKINLLKYKPFYLLIIPNLLRGFNSGIFVTTMTIGYTLGITDKSSSATLTLILQASAIFGNFLFSKYSAPGRNVKFSFFGSLGLIVFMPLMMTGSLPMFYVMYFLSSICIALIDISIPCVVVEIVDFEFMGQFSSYRMLLHTLGITVSSLAAIPLLNLLGGVGTMILSASFQIIAGTAYLLMTKSVKTHR